MLKKDKKRRKQSVSDEEQQPVYEHAEVDSASVPPHESGIDEVTLKSLTIQRDYLSEIASSLPKPPVHKTTNRRVFVRKLRPVSEPLERPASKTVKVVRPLPQGSVPTGAVTSLCPPDWRPGPRYTEAGQLIPHSILGTEEEFCCEAEARDRHVSIQLPLGPRGPKPRVRKTWFEQVPRQENALRHWQQRMRDRRRQQEHIATRVDRPAGHLVMNQSDSYIDRQTLRTLLDRAAPYLEYGRGYRAGSEFWNQQERLGDYLTGIRMSLTSTERGQPPQVQLVGRPDVTKFETGTEFSDALQPPNYPWKQSRYLSTRLQHFEPILSEMNPLDPDLSSLYVIGRGPQARRSEAIQLGSAGSSPESSDGETGEGERNVSHGTPGPGLLVQEGYRLGLGVTEPIQLRLLMEGSTGELVQARVSLSNTGTSVVYADWKKLPKLNKLNRVLEGDTQRFYFDLREKVLLPGHAISVPVIFKSAQAGVYWESWELATRPALQPLVVTFRGVATTRDKFFQVRQEVERELVASEARVSAEMIVEDILLSIATPPRTPPCYKLDRTHEEKFSRLNPDVEFREDLFRALQTLYINSFSPPTLADRADSVEARKDGKSSAKKEDNKGKTSGKPAAKKGEKSEKKEELSPSKLTLLPTQQEYSTLSRDKISEGMSELPEWDLRLESLESAILNTSGNEQQADLLLAQFSEVLTQFNSPSQPLPQNSNYQHMYLALVQALELIPCNSAKLRTFYNLPDKAFIDESQPELGESVVSPTDMNKKKRGLSKQDVSKKPPPKKGAAKEETPSKPKGSTPSRKGKASVTPRTQQDTLPTELTPEVPKTTEVDPATERLYSLELRQSVCDMLHAAIGNFLLSVA